MGETDETAKISSLKIRSVEIPEIFMRREVWSVSGGSEAEVSGKTILFRESLPLSVFEDWLENGLRPVTGLKGHNNPLPAGSRHPEAISFTARKVKELIPVLAGTETFAVGLDPKQVKAHGKMFYHVGANLARNPLDLSALGIQEGKAPKTTENPVWVNEVHFQPDEQFLTVPADWSITVSLPGLRDNDFQRYLDMLDKHKLCALVFREFMHQ